MVLTLIIINTKFHSLLTTLHCFSTLFDGTSDSLKAALNTLEIFGSLSGLVVNKDKRKLIWLGEKKHSTDMYDTNKFLSLYKKLKICLNDIQNFMFTNTLKLNPAKTELILIGSKNNPKQLLPHFLINILGNQVSPAQSVRNLRVVFDSNFSFSDHVTQVIKSTRFHARNLYRIRPLLDLNTSVLLANALVRSRLDYCNSLFLSLTDFELRRLQLVQNSLCRVVTRSSKYSHITPQLKKLHWLPVKYRIQFKIGLITYKILNQGQPVYLRELIHPYTSSRNTRRSTPKLKFLHTPTFDLKVHKSNTFSILSVTMPQFFGTLSPSK